MPKIALHAEKLKIFMAYAVTPRFVKIKRVKIRTQIKIIVVGMVLWPIFFSKKSKPHNAVVVYTYTLARINSILYCPTKLSDLTANCS